MVQHQSRVFYGLKITLPIDKDSDNTFCVDWNSLPRLIMTPYDTLQHRVVVSMCIDSKILNICFYKKNYNRFN